MGSFYVRPSIHPSVLAGWMGGLAGWMGGLAGWLRGLAGGTDGRTYVCTYIRTYGHFKSTEALHFSTMINWEAKEITEPPLFIN